MCIKIIKVDYLKHGHDLMSLLNGYALDPMGGGKALPLYTQENLVSQLAKTPHAFSVLAYKNDQAIGLINCFEAFSTFACKPLINVHDVVVKKEFRGQGISQMMLKKVEEIARSKDCCKITLEILSNNDVAKSAYSKFGFSSFELDPSAGTAIFWQKKL